MDKPKKGCTEEERLKKNGEMTPNNLVRIPVRLFSVKLKMWRLFLAIKLMVNRGKYR